jgi:hypothetical protein
MDHHDSNVLCALHGDLVLHVHLIDRDVAALCGDWADARFRYGFVVAANEEASFSFDRQRYRLLRIR